MLLFGEGSGCFGSVFLSLDIVRSWARWLSSRRALLREETTFLIPCGRASINVQSKYTTGVNGLTYFRLLAPSVAAQLFGGFGFLGAGPYRLEGGGVTSGFILPLGLMDGSGRKTAPDEVWWVMKALEFGMKYGRGNHCYFCHFANATSLPPDPLTSET